MSLVYKARLLTAPRGGREGADVPLCVAMTVILCHCSCSRSSSITVLIKPVSEAMRNRASGSDWGSMEYLRYRSEDREEEDSEEKPRVRE